MVAPNPGELNENADAVGAVLVPNERPVPNPPNVDAKQNMLLFEQTLIIFSEIT